MGMLLLLVTGLALVVAAAGCGGSSQGFISTETAVAAFRQAGFRNLYVLSNRRDAEQLGKRYAATAADIDTIVQKVNGRVNLFFPPLLVARLQSASVAKKRYAIGWSAKAMRDGLAQYRKHGGVLPRHFDLRRVTSLQVCNLLISSYNPNGDRGLTARFRRAVRLLRAKC